MPPESHSPARPGRSRRSIGAGSVYDDAMVDVWPLALHDGELALRPLRPRDRAAFERLRERNARLLRPWDAADAEHGVRPGEVRVLYRWNQEQARLGRAVPRVR